VEIKFKLIGVKTISGISKKTGGDYSFSRAYAIEQIKTDKFVSACAGYEPRELDIDQAVFLQLKDKPFPIDVSAICDFDRDNKLKIVQIFFVSKPETLQK